MARNKFTFTAGSVQAIQGGKKAARIAVAKAGWHRYVPQKKQPPKPDPGTWWLNLSPSEFYAEASKRHVAQLQQESRICYARKESE